jgi:hypothetical protein
VPAVTFSEDLVKSFETKSSIGQDEPLLSTPESPKAIDGERLSPDGGVGSPKAIKDDSHSLTSDTKTTTTTTTATTTKTKEEEENCKPMTLNSAAKDLEGSVLPEPTVSKTPLAYRATLPAMPSSHPRVRPQVPKTSPRGTMEARYHIGGLNKPSPLVNTGQKTNLESGSPTGMGMKVETNPSQEILHSNGVPLRRRERRRQCSPPSGHPSNPTISSLKAMHRMSRSVGEALDQLAAMDVNDPSSIIFNSAPNSTHATPTSTPSDLKMLANDDEVDGEVFPFEGETRRELSSSPVSTSLPLSLSLSTTSPHGKSHVPNGVGHINSSPAHSPTSNPRPQRKLSREDKGIIDATGTLPRGAKIRRSFNVKQRWRDDMQTENENGDSGRNEHGLEEEIKHWKRVAGSLQQQLSTTKFNLDKKGKMLNLYETDFVTLSAKLQTMEEALEEKSKESQLVHKSSGGSIDTESLFDGDDDIFKEKGKRKKKGWKNFTLKLGKKANQEVETTQKKSDVSVSLDMVSPQGDPSQDLHKKKWSSKENLLAEITNLREQVTHLQQQNIELKRRSLSPRDALTASNPSPSVSPRNSRGFEVDQPLLDFVDIEEGVPVPVVLHDEFRTGMDQKCNTFIGHVNIHDRTSWEDMDGKILAIFKHHVWSIDPEEGMGLVDDSICTYSFMGNWRDIGEAKPPQEDPLTLTNRPNPHIVVYLKGVRQRSSDLLAYQLLLNVTLVESYVDMIMKNKWLVLMGARGSFKTKMATHMARFLSNKLFGISNKYLTFSMDTDGTQISGVLEWLQSNADNPQTHILLVDGVFECNGVEQILNAASLMETKPYLLITIAQAHSRGSSLHSLMFRFPVRMISCTPQSEPINTMLPRQLRKQLLELKAHRKDVLDPCVEQLIHWLPRLLDYLNGIIVKYHSATVALGPAIFLPCPLHLAPQDLEHWFISQWNHFISPYIRGSVMAGVESRGMPFGAEWKDPKDWVLEGYPWTDSRSKEKLQSITDEDVGLGHGLRISPQTSISASTYAASVVDAEIQSMMDVQSNSS